MNPKDIKYTVTYGGLNRKRQIIDQTLQELHNLQLDMIDQAVEYSDLRDAKEIINYIKSK